MTGVSVIPDTQIVGVGYQGRNADQLIDSLRCAQVSVVVDVRWTPISRKAGLSKTALRHGLAAAGIDYRHLRGLGNPKYNRAGFAGSQAELEAAREEYRNLLCAPEAVQALDELRQRAQHDRIALLCFEADEHRCHRRVLLEMLTGAAGEQGS